METKDKIKKIIEDELEDYRKDGIVLTSALIIEKIDNVLETDNRLINQIRSEIRFLKSQGIIDLIHDADIGCCHQECLHIENRIEKLQSRLTKG